MTTALDPPSWVQSNRSDPPAPERDLDARGDRYRGAHDLGAHGSAARPPRERPASEPRHDGRRFEARDHAAGSFRAEDYLDQRDYAAELSNGSQRSNGWGTTPKAESVEIEYADAADDEEIWGPRPKLLATESGGRRTVVITGRGGDRAVVARSNPREDLPVGSRHGFQADRTAMWAVLLCVIVLVAALATH